MVPLVLEGDPRGGDRIVYSANVEVPRRVTIDHYGRHEHFECTGDIDMVAGCVAAVFRWVDSTKIAE